jgi:hypothetical protein
LSATAGTGGAVAASWYTTDGTDPHTSATRSQYTGPFAVTHTTLVSFYSADVAGNAEPTQTRRIQVDTVKPTVRVTSPASGSSFSRNTKVVISASAGDVGSGVANVAFCVDGNRLSTDWGSPYQRTWNTRYATLGQHVITAVARDVARNRTTSVKVYVTVTS